MAKTTETEEKKETYEIKRHHVHWGILIVVLLLGGAIVGGFYAGGGSVQFANGHAVVTNPNLDTFLGRVQIKGQNGKVMQAQIKPVASQTQPNGQTSTTKDGFGSEGRLQRTETHVNRYDPIDKLTASVDQTNNNVASLTTSVSNLNGNVQKLTDSVKTIDNRVGALDHKVDRIDTRVSRLEKQRVKRPAAESMLTPRHETVRSTTLASAGRTEVAQNIVTPRTVNQREMKLMLEAYGDNGPVPGGGHIKGFEVLHKGQTFRCPDGSPARRVSVHHDRHGTAARWACPRR